MALRQLFILHAGKAACLGNAPCRWPGSAASKPSSPGRLPHQPESASTILGATNACAVFGFFIFASFVPRKPNTTGFWLCFRESVVGRPGRADWSLMAVSHQVRRRVTSLTTRKKVLFQKKVQKTVPMKST
jgi:hypothetical protein